MTDAASHAQFLIVMGVSGSGKTTLGEGIAEAMGWLYAEGDDFHSQANVSKMASGVPLTDEDRWPWLRAIGTWIDEHERDGRSAVVTCSALKRTYRDLLREGRDNVRFVYLDVPQQVLEERLAKRTGHYMPPSLLPSQLSALEPLQDDEDGVVVHAHQTPEASLAEALDLLGLTAKA
ncbi:MAG TPA: gluconokinase [Flexivirga sp.]|uniref:gluconokinase n=1 Tax=Flexivirga sp. TaxID=1962927 RepID=UPI002B799447|nr:gluconokinase [Flexivirga sp.]HWC24923.1 gluconokinase [Flexivirga sp.]